jgi:hypothetical protein
MSESKEELNSVAEMWSRRPQDPYISSKDYLVLGATFDEDKRQRTHYNNPRVFLLGKEPPQDEYEGYDERDRYIHANFDSQYADELREMANAYQDRFDEIAFDESTMCGFISEDAEQTLMHRIKSFYIMLKQNGILFFSETSDDIINACRRFGFETKQIRLADLHKDNLPKMLKFSRMEDRTILFGIKTGKKTSGRNINGGRGSGSRKRKLISRNRKLRKTARR